MQLDSKEDEARVFRINETSLPISVKSPARRYYIETWSEFSDMLLDVTPGLSLIEHVRTLTVRDGQKWKPISLESLAFIPDVAMFLIDYSRATSDYVKGYLFDGELSDQPNIYYGIGQAFSVISSAKSECEIENHRDIKRKSISNGRHKE